MKKLLLAAILEAATGAGAATSFSPDASDMWWNPTESGWGMNVVQQGNIAFATLFLYGADGRAHWYAAPRMAGQSAPTDRPMYFTGTLYETTGPTFATTFNPSAVGVPAGGPIEFENPRPRGGQLAYRIDGVTVSKHASPPTWLSAHI